jgi:hypothetical protein
MALSANTITRTRASCTAGTSVLPTIIIPDNCHTIVFLSREASGGDTILIGQGTAGGAIADNGTATALTAGAALTLSVGYLSERIDSLQDLIYDCDANTANCDITYLCHAGQS